MAIIYIYGDRAISLIFYNNKDIESDSRDIEMCAPGPIFTQKNIRVCMGQQHPYHNRWEKNVASTNHIYGARAILLLFGDHQDTESQSCEIEMSRYQPKITH